MEKGLRWWHKVPCLPLRLLLLVLCAWAVYTISTGLISPSVSPAPINSWQANHERLIASSKTTTKQPLGKHYLQDSKNNDARLKLQPRSKTNAQKQNERYQKSSTSSDTGKSQSKDDIREEGMTKPVHNTVPHETKWPSDRRRSVSHGLREEKYRDVDFRETKNGFSEISSGLNTSPSHISVHEPKPEQTDDTRKNYEPANNGTEEVTYLRENTDHETGNDVFGLTNSTLHSAPHKYIDKYGFRNILPSEQGLASPVSTKHGNTHSSHTSGRFKDIKRILLWTSLDDGWNLFPKEEDAFANCSEVRCEITSDRNRLKESHAVVFHVRTMSLIDVPSLRLAHQKWIFFCLEPPPQSYFPGFHFMRGMFNWTMTYRGDSDIVIPYGKVIPRSLPPKSSNGTRTDRESLWKMKTRPVIWMVSHCDTYSKREAYVHQLQKFIDVDILGGCGAAVCPFDKTDKCLEAFSRRYKFILAFENSICDDYVTEKFFRALKYDIVPVVLGGADYGAVAPPGSYINAADFATPEALADYLHRVSQNFTLYNAYLKWKDSGYYIQDTSIHCSLCQKVHSSDFRDSSTYNDMVTWWVENSHCTKWTSK